MHPTRTGRWECDDAKAAVSRDDRIAEQDFVIRKILSGHNTAICSHPFRGRLGKRATIEPIAALFRDVAICGRKIGLFQQTAFVERLPAFKKYCARGIETC